MNRRNFLLTGSSSVAVVTLAALLLSGALGRALLAKPPPAAPSGAALRAQALDLAVLNRRAAIHALTAAVATVMLSSARAYAQTPIKFQLDWRFEGPSALFLAPLAKGYFKDAGLDVTIDAGNGSGGTVTRVASGTYDMGFADMAALMEFHANNPDAPNKPVAVMMVYNNTPAAVLALKKSGIAKRFGFWQSNSCWSVKRRQKNQSSQWY